MTKRMDPEIDMQPWHDAIAQLARAIEPVTVAFQEAIDALRELSTHQVFERVLEGEHTDDTPQNES